MRILCQIGLEAPEGCARCRLVVLGGRSVAGGAAAELYMPGGSPPQIASVQIPSSPDQVGTGLAGLAKWGGEALAAPSTLS
jgi:hypothetical protein